MSIRPDGRCCSPQTVSTLSIPFDMVVGQHPCCFRPPADSLPDRRQPQTGFPNPGTTSSDYFGTPPPKSLVKSVFSVQHAESTLFNIRRTPFDRIGLRCFLDSSNLIRAGGISGIDWWIRSGPGPGKRRHCSAGRTAGQAEPAGFQLRTAASPGFSGGDCQRRIDSPLESLRPDAI